MIFFSFLALSRWVLDTTREGGFVTGVFVSGASGIGG